MKESRIRAVCAVPMPYDSAPSQRYRWEQWQPWLEQSGITLEFLPFADEKLDAEYRNGVSTKVVGLTLKQYPGAIVRLMKAAAQADLLIIHRKATLVGPAIFERIAARLHAPLVYDFDDALFHPPQASALHRLLRGDGRCRQLTKAAQLVTVGNTFLAEFANRYSSNVVVIPTTVNTTTHAPRRVPKPDGARPVVGWSGSPSTARYLENILPEIRAAQEEVDFELLVMGAQVNLSGIQGRCEPWSSAREVEVLHQMDVGLMPLEDSLWERGKCSLKALLYGAVGIPSIVSDVGTNPQAVLHRKTGLLVGANESWREAIVDLVRDADLRAILGNQARAHIAQNYCPEKWAPVLAQALRRAAEGKNAQQ